MNFPGFCALCGGQDDGKGALLPKAWAHINCTINMGGDPWLIADTLPCCQSAITLRQLGGMAIEYDDRIPTDELWVINKMQRKVLRHKINAWGQLERIQDPVRVEGDVEIVGETREDTEEVPYRSEEGGVRETSAEGTTGLPDVG